jgi:hypothetical protein
MLLFFAAFAVKDLTGGMPLAPLCQQAAREALLQHLHDRRGIAALWLPDQQMKMLGHDGISDHDKIVAPANLLQNFEKPRISKQSAAASAAE